MGNVRARTQDGKLFFDFRHEGRRCREYTALEDTPANRRQLQRVLNGIEQAIAAGSFDYAQCFPNSPRLRQPGVAAAPAAVAMPPRRPAATATPLFGEFAAQWVRENEIGWRRSYRRTIADMLQGRLMPAFGSVRVGHITRAATLAFRSELAHAPGRKGKHLSAKRINALVKVS